MRIKITTFLEVPDEDAEAQAGVLVNIIKGAIAATFRDCPCSVSTVVKPREPVTAEGPPRRVPWSGTTRSVARLLTAYAMQAVRDCPEVEDGKGNCSCSLYIRELLEELLHRPAHNDIIQDRCRGVLPRLEES